MDSPGALAGSVLNAFAINDGTVVHVLTGTATMSMAGTLTAMRRAAGQASGTVSLLGAVDMHRIQKFTGVAVIALRDVVNVSQRHNTRGSGDFRLLGNATAIARRSATVAATIRLKGTSASHLRVAASAASTIRLRGTRAAATRRQIAIATNTMHFRHLVNLRAIAPIYGRDEMNFQEAATAVRRVGLPSIGRIVLSGIATTITRRTIRTQSTIKLLSTIKMPHYRMTPVEEIRAMRMMPDVRGMAVIPEPLPIVVTPDNRELVVPQRGRMIGTPDIEDPA